MLSSNNKDSLFISLSYFKIFSFRETILFDISSDSLVYFCLSFKTFILASIFSIFLVSSINNFCFSEILSSISFILSFLVKISISYDDVLDDSDTNSSFRVSILVFVFCNLLFRLVISYVIKEISISFNSSFNSKYFLAS